MWQRLLVAHPHLYLQSCLWKTLVTLHSLKNTRSSHRGQSRSRETSSSRNPFSASDGWTANRQMSLVCINSEAHSILRPGYTVVSWSPIATQHPLPQSWAHWAPSSLVCLCWLSLTLLSKFPEMAPKDAACTWLLILETRGL